MLVGFLTHKGPDAVGRDAVGRRRIAVILETDFEVVTFNHSRGLGLEVDIVGAAEGEGIVHGTYVAEQTVDTRRTITVEEAFVLKQEVAVGKHTFEVLDFEQLEVVVGKNLVVGIGNKLIPLNLIAPAVLLINTVDSNTMILERRRLGITARLGGLEMTYITIFKYVVERRTMD